MYPGIYSGIYPGIYYPCFYSGIYPGTHGYILGHLPGYLPRSEQHTEFWYLGIYPRVCMYPIQPWPLGQDELHETRLGHKVRYANSYISRVFFRSVCTLPGYLLGYLLPGYLLPGFLPRYLPAYNLNGFSYIPGYLPAYDQQKRVLVPGYPTYPSYPIHTKHTLAAGQRCATCDTPWSE